jgi:hypothetical protein
MEEFLAFTFELREQTLTRLQPTFEALGHFKMIEPLREQNETKSRAWGAAIAAHLNLRFAAPECIEMMRSRFATSTLVTRWFAQMAPHIQGIPPELIFNFDEIMVYAKRKGKVITTCDKKVFRRETKQDPHITLGLCVAPFGHGPPPSFIFTGKRKPADFESFERTGKIQVLNSDNGWMTCALFDEWAMMFVTWLDEYRTKLFPNSRAQQALLFVDNCRSHCSLTGSESLRCTHSLITTAKLFHSLLT